jgi:hypothetical protein
MGITENKGLDIAGLIFCYCSAAARKTTTEAILQTSASSLQITHWNFTESYKKMEQLFKLSGQRH